MKAVKGDKNMLKKANINWTAKQMVKMKKNGTANFEHAVQRGLVWNKKKASLYVHSLIEGYPIPPFYAKRSESGYIFLDGKQRCTMLEKFMDDEFALVDIPEVTLENGDTIEIEGMNYSQLPEEVQDAICSYSLTIYYFENITEEEVAEMFFRLNNGTPLTNIELTRVRSKSMAKIGELGQHKLFTETMTKNSLNKYTNEDIVIRSYLMTIFDEPDLSAPKIREVMQTREITDSEEKDLLCIFDYIYDVYQTLEEKEKKKKLMTKTHFITMIPVIMKAFEKNVNANQFAEWFNYFFSGNEGPTISEKYNNTCKAGSTKKENIVWRVNAALDDFYKLFSAQGQKEETDQVVEREKEQVEII